MLDALGKTTPELDVSTGGGDVDDVVLKIDIEGGEWELLDALTDPRVTRHVSQLLLELHVAPWGLGKDLMFKSNLEIGSVAWRRDNEGRKSVTAKL